MLIILEVFSIYLIIEHFVVLNATCTLDVYFLFFPCGSHVVFSCFPCQFYNCDVLVSIFRFRKLGFLVACPRLGSNYFANF